MKVFISWSGERSKAVATLLASDIAAGSRWNREVQDLLAESRFGIICLTTDNLAAPWILFEAGALAKTIEETFVCPYLIDLEPSEIVGPLTQFQAKRATETETFELIRTINRALKEDALAEGKLDKAFEKWWPDLEGGLEKLPAASTPAEPPRSTEEMTEEILITVRDIKRALSGDPNWAFQALIGQSVKQAGADSGIDRSEFDKILKTLRFRGAYRLTQDEASELEHLENIDAENRSRPKRQS